MDSNTLSGYKVVFNLWVLPKYINFRSRTMFFTRTVIEPHICYVNTSIINIVSFFCPNIYLYRFNFQISNIPIFRALICHSNGDFDLSIYFHSRNLPMVHIGLGASAIIMQQSWSIIGLSWLGIVVWRKQTVELMSVMNKMLTIAWQKGKTASPLMNDRPCYGIFDTVYVCMYTRGA